MQNLDTQHIIYKNNYSLNFVPETHLDAKYQPKYSLSILNMQKAFIGLHILNENVMTKETHEV